MMMIAIRGAAPLFLKDWLILGRMSRSLLNF